MIKKSVLLTALAIAGFAVTSLAQTVPNYVPTNGLVGWWPFNGNAIDESVNTNDGTVNGATLTADRFGNAGKAYYFFNNYIVLNGSSSINFTDSLSINLWYNNNLVNGGTFIANHTSGTINSSFVMYNEGITGCGPINYITNINSQIHFVDFPTFCDTIDWHMLSLVFKKPILKMYVDGSLIDSILNCNTIKSTSNPIVIGGASSSNTPAIQSGTNASIDDIGIWNRALTQSEITGLYNANLCFQTITVTDTLLINTNITGFNPVTYQNTIKIWPNPTNDHITIDNGNLANLTGHQIKISNALGQQVFQSAITQQQFYVNMSTWGGNGIYFVNLINAQGVTIETRKIVLQ
jgi:hypothetical protein